MERYAMEFKLGDGTFGTVWKAVDRRTGDAVAVKKMKRVFPSWDECLALREVVALRALRHPAIVRLREVVREHERLYLVFEFAGASLYSSMRGASDFLPPETPRAWARQALAGLAYMHGKGFAHRDVKPENLLVDGGGRIKLADLGLARAAACADPVTEYVATRWYRAPEVLLRAPGGARAPADVFAMGAVLAEMLALRPLLPGASEADQLAVMARVLGAPGPAWPEAGRLAAAAGHALPRGAPSGPTLAADLAMAPPEAVDLVRRMCAWDPGARPTAAQALAHAYFGGARRVVAAAGEPGSAAGEVAAAAARLAAAAARCQERERRRSSAASPAVQRLALQRRAARRHSSVARPQAADAGMAGDAPAAEGPAATATPPAAAKVARLGGEGAPLGQRTSELLRAYHAEAGL